MELIYLHIEKYNGIINKQEINFSPNFHVKIMNKKLIIENKVSFMDKVYPKGIKNITMLLGKNGSGKTTILDILGMNRTDRCSNSIKRKGRSRSEIVDSYFMLYHLQGDYFGIEIMDDIESGEKITKLFKNNLTNFSFDELKDPFYKIPMGLVVKKEDDNFQIIEHFFRQIPLLGNKISEQIRVNYIANKFSDKIDIKNAYISKDEENYERDDYLFKRRYFLKSSKEMQYKFVNHLNNYNCLHFCGKSAVININPNFDYGIELAINNVEMEKWVHNLEEALDIDKTGRINILRLFEDKQKNEEMEFEDTKRGYKSTFMLDTLSSFIIHQFIKGICDMIDSNRQQKNTNEPVCVDLMNSEHTEFLNNLKKEEYVQSNSNFLFGDLSNKEMEYENLIKIIKFYKEDEILNTFDKLIYISRYLYSRMESTIDLGSESRYQIAIEDFLNALNNLNEVYFHKRFISINCNSEVDDAVVKAFRIYDNFFNNQFSDIRMRFKINILNLSEGEYCFLDLLSKIFDIIEESKENQLSLILLDEPDQTLHPEWSRRLIKFLCDEIERFINRNIQIVLSTHSPFIVTDIMSDHIYCFENIITNDTANRNIKIYSMNTKSDKIHNTFSANIYEILKDSFILEKTIGEFSYNKIECLIHELNNKLENNNDFKYQEFLINSIGEFPLRKKLLNLYNQKREKELKIKVLDQIKMENNVEKLNKIAQILNGDKYD